MQSRLSELAAEIPSYEIHKTKIEIDRSKIETLFAALEDKFSDATFGKMDGLRLDWEDKWMLVRPSNTEPIVRAIAEATTMADAKELCEAAAELTKAI